MHLKLAMANMNHNAMPTEANTTLTVCILIEPKRLQALNETTFLAAFAVGILAEEIGIVIETIDNWLGKPVVITCDEVTAVPLPHVLECARGISRADSVVFNPKTDDLHSDSLHSIPNGPHSLMTSPVSLKPVGQPLLNTIPGIP